MTSPASVRARAALVVAAALIAPAAAGQLITRVSGPVIGYVWYSQQHQLRPLQGVLGSATVGDPVDLGVEISDALELGPSRLLLTSSGPALLAVDLSTDPPSVGRVAGASFVPALATSSRGGSAAALYDRATRTIAIVTGLPESPRVAHRVGVLQLNAPVTTMAVSDDGSTLVYAVSGGELASLFSWNPTSGVRALVDTSAVSALALLAGNGVAVANPRDNEVFLVSGLGGSTRRRTLAGPGQGISNPVGLAAASNGARIHVANGGSSNVTTFEVTGRLVGNRRCNCEISGLKLVGESLYRLTGQLDRTLFLFDARSAESRILFVPPVG
ncbi:MAG TPA: hypothetical protein VFV95_09130 [Vicinamibacterales bacterium]|nr:hypothetical protein [Vicinamibacterales bacterium]